MGNKHQLSSTTKPSKTTRMMMKRGAASASVALLATIVVLLCGLAVAQQCVTCPDQSKCCGGEICCKDGNSYGCCPAGGTCCNDTCCDNTQSCCEGTCCEKQTTFCCPKLSPHPARCCPRWTVCCPGGQDGCCTPFEAQAYMAQPFTKMHLKEDSVKAGSKVIYALFNEVSTVKAVTIDAETGKILANKKVEGFNNWGEMTRLFTYDESRNLFYYMEANFLSDTLPRPLYLYTVDPVTGQATKKTVQGANNFPSGYTYSCTLDAIVLGTEKLDGSGNRVGYLYYTVDPTTAVATKKSESSFQGEDDYAGWFHAVSVNGSLALRQGYKNVVEESVSGLGVTSLSSPTTAVQWYYTQAAASHNFYETLNPIADGVFLSLAQQSVGNHSYDLLKWSPGGVGRVVASLGNSHPVPFFGYVASQLNCKRSTLLTATVEAHAPAILNDRWVIGVFDVSSSSFRQLDIDPKLPAEETSVSGLGVIVDAPST
ncbi:hypothetical protein PTSG_00332 [Salpingoeca rosetta]|uniref:Uncharacterized protein n=1 Tax=Salpingoeca rosetta (strain ATCC 50818 / BSB-021) TaxID=946362 RepID=F2TW68_SALR5|nr:uncharacterized protein PTSG_00332 [Salpingoeca rosetta]EGD72314.1 hypothetical protein PTSG_00332 [Salpingoeca rosetta]|eukprot:XP_004998884.1 hypothetical protein PTSG_00332 [Salpingoeca rosetta]